MDGRTERGREKGGMGDGQTDDIEREDGGWMGGQVDKWTDGQTEGGREGVEGGGEGGRNEEEKILSYI